MAGIRLLSCRLLLESFHYIVRSVAIDEAVGHEKVDYIRGIETLRFHGLVSLAEFVRNGLHFPVTPQLNVKLARSSLAYI